MGGNAIPIVLCGVYSQSGHLIMNTGLTPVELIYAYSSGFFPMAHEEDDNAIYWHRPAMRGIIPLDSFHISKNLARLYRKNKYQCT